ncbi:MAG: bifunctional aminoglycoside phosphotransferase/ATP-binding protein, partial [Gammaproteobacteria bacterium]
MPISNFIQALLEPEIYPHPCSSVRLVETHISWVLLTGSYAYKVKKPVRLGFLDFSSLSSRRHFCEEELRLNRRLAPQLYLEVVAIGGSPDHPVFSATTPAIEYAVKMRQFDRESGFDRLAKSRRLQPVHIDRLAETIAAFHLRAPRLPATDFSTLAEQIHRRALRNFSEIETLATPPDPDDSVARLVEWTGRQYLECRTLMQNRGKSGFVRECHGDLHLANIVLIDERPIPFDCIEFSEAMRWIDVIDEIAFLVMDLQAHDLPEYGYRLLNRYLQITGDYPALPLFDYYRVYRAIVRAKVALLSRVPSGEHDEKNRLLESEYRNYLSIALSSTRRKPPILMITHGLSGSGKSTVAGQIAAKLPGIQLRSDIERKRLAARDEGFNQTRYNEEATRITYRLLAETAESLLASGYSVIVDAT